MSLLEIVQRGFMRHEASADTPEPEATMTPYTLVAAGDTIPPGSVVAFTRVTAGVDYAGIMRVQEAQPFEDGRLTCKFTGPGDCPEANLGGWDYCRGMTVKHLRIVNPAFVPERNSIWTHHSNDTTYHVHTLLNERSNRPNFPTIVGYYEHGKSPNFCYGKSLPYFMATMLLEV